MDKKFKICERAKSYAEEKGTKDIDFNSIKEIIPSERFSIWTAAEESAGHDFCFWIEKAKIEAFERDGEIKLKIFRHATAFKGAETIKMTFTLTGWEVDIADGDLAFTFDVKEIPETWIWAKCECPGYYK